MFMGSTNICDCTVIFIEVGVITIRFSVVYTTSYMQAIFKQRKLLTCERYFSFLCSIFSSLSECFYSFLIPLCLFDIIMCPHLMFG